MHLVRIHNLVDEFKPRVVVVDPITTFFTGVSAGDADSMILRLVDFLKTRDITSVFTHPVETAKHAGRNDVGMASLIDTWIGLHEVEEAGERRRVIRVLKSRGMPHSTTAHALAITTRGVQVDARLGGKIRGGTSSSAATGRRAAPRSRAQGASR
jgi:circadian clock protein KaiC